MGCIFFLLSILFSAFTIGFFIIGIINIVSGEKGFIAIALGLLFSGPTVFFIIRFFKKAKMSKSSESKKDNEENIYFNNESIKDEAAELLKEATALKKSGNVEEAIKILKNAYIKMENKIGDNISVDILVRLPQYLQEAGKNDEAWGEFNKLIIEISSRKQHAGIRPIELAQIHDKMRLFLQREGKDNLAIRHGIFFYLYWAVGLYKQNRKDELDSYFIKQNIEAMLKDLLKKAKKEHLLDKISSLVGEQLEHLPNIKFNEAAHQIDALLNES